MYNQFNFLGFAPFQASKKIDELFKNKKEMEIRIEDVLEETYVIPELK